MNWSDSKSVLWGFLTDYNGSHRSVLLSSITLPHCLSKKKKPGRFVIVGLFCWFLKRSSRFVFKISSGKGDHHCTKFSGPLGLGTKILGFQVSPVL